jgi:hypothetical protein
MVAENKSAAPRRRALWPAFAALLLSAAYLAFYLRYLDRSIGLEYLQELLPYELGQVISGGALPLLLIWLLASFAMRRGELNHHTAQLRQRLQQLTYPAEDGTERVGTIAAALRQQTVDLTAATDAAHDVLASVRHAFRSQTGDLTEVAQTAAERQQQVEASLAEQRRLLAEMTELIDQQRQQLSVAGQDQVGALEKLAASGVDRIVNVLDDKRVVIERIIDRILDHGSTVRDAVEAEAERLGDVADQAAAKLGDEIAAVTARLDEAARQAADSERSLRDHVDAQSIALEATSTTTAERLTGIIGTLKGGIEQSGDAAAQLAAAMATKLDQALQKSHAEVDDQLRAVVEKLDEQGRVILAATTHSKEAQGELVGALERGAAALQYQAEVAGQRLGQAVLAEQAALEQAAASSEARHRDFELAIGGHLAGLAQAVEGHTTSYGERVEAERQRVAELSRSAEQRHADLVASIDLHRQALTSAADDAAQRLATSLKRHQEVAFASANATIAEVTRKTSEVQRSLREQGDAIVQTSRNVADELIGGLMRLGEQIAKTGQDTTADHVDLKDAMQVQAGHLNQAVLNAATWRIPPARPSISWARG